MNKPEPSLQALKLLATIAAEGRLTKAARRLGMSQSAASHALRSHEKTLGGTLFVRDRTGLKLSVTGARVLPHVRKVLEGLDDLRAGCEPHIKRLFEDAGIACPSHQTVKQLGTIFTMVAERLGVSVVPSIAVRTAPRGTRTLPLARRRFRRIGLIQRDDAAPSPVTQAWVDLTSRYTWRSPHAAERSSDRGLL